MTKINKVLVFIVPTILVFNLMLLPTPAAAAVVKAPSGSISVKDLGAKGDGVADDSNAIEAAMYKALKGKRVVYLPPGTYYGGSKGRYIDIPANLTIVGAGSDATILTNIGLGIASPNITVEHLSNRNTNRNIIGVLIQTGANNTYIKDVVVTKQTKAYAAFNIYAKGGKTLSGVVFEDCIANGVSGYGFFVYGDGNKQTSVQNVQYIDCKAIKCGYNSPADEWAEGFALNDYVGSYSNISYTNCEASYCLECGFYQESAPDMTNISYTNCTSSYNGQKPKALFGDGFLINGQVTMTGCKAVGNKGSAGYAIQTRRPPNITISNCSDDSSKYSLYLYQVSGGSINLNMSTKNKANRNFYIQDGKPNITGTLKANTGSSIINYQFPRDTKKVTG